MIEDVRSYYGFTKTPFGRDLPASALHRHRAQQEAVARIAFTITDRGLGVLTGEVGAGKTVAVRAAVATLDRSRHTVIYLPNPSVGQTGIYAAIVTSLGALPRYRKAELIAQATNLLATEEHERGRVTVLIVDEAHLLGAGELEELRLLTNAEMDSHSPFAAILIGQPTLRRQIKLGHFAALDQRITMRYHLDGMDLEQTTSYIKHHLALTGRSDPLFSDDATAAIHQASRGLPRAVNNHARTALTAAYLDKKSIVDIATAKRAIKEINDD
jgi:type II secretory pathway predicted ATPase ExeA